MPGSSVEQENKKLLTIVVPVYFNELNLPDTIPQLLALKSDLLGYDLELIFVDDGSDDRSLPLLLDFQQQHPDEIKVVKLIRNFGSMAAIQAGCTVALGGLCGHDLGRSPGPPRAFLEMLRHLENGSKAVFAVRQDREESPAQKFFSKS